MKQLIYCLMLLTIAASFASAASMFKTPGEAEADFCFGYAVCE